MEQLIWDTNDREGKTAMTEKNNIRSITETALMAAALCILGPLSIPIGPVPISLTNFTIYLFMYLLDTKQVSIAYLIYLLLGLVGLPVFSGYTGGIPKLFGPTGGYLIGFLPMAVIGGIALQKARQNRALSVLVLEAVTWIPYLLGTAWLSYSTKMTFAAAFAAGVIPFILIDLAKIVVCAVVGPAIRIRIARVGVASS